MLAKWLTGADATHPLLSPEMTDRFLDTLERIAAPVDAANPVRLPTKTKAFRTLKTRTELLEQRAELLIGSMLARGGVPFEFGKDHPDYVLADSELGIEVGSRALDGPWALHDARCGRGLVPETGTPATILVSCAWGSCRPPSERPGGS